MNSYFYELHMHITDDGTSARYISNVIELSITVSLTARLFGHQQH